MENQHYQSTTAFLLFKSEDMDFHYGKQVFEAIYSALKGTNGNIAFNDGDLLNKKTFQNLLADFQQIIPSVVFPNFKTIDFINQVIEESFLYIVGMWSDMYIHFEKLHSFLNEEKLPGYLGFIIMNGVIDRNSFQNNLELKLKFSRSIFLSEGRIIPETSKYGIGDSLSENDKLLFKAVRTNNIQLVKRALSQGANVDSVKDEEGRESPLLIAVINNQIEIVKELLLHGASPNTSNGINTVLILAIRYKYIPIIKLLLDNNTDVNYPDFSGWSPLDCIESELEESNSIEYQKIRDLIIEHGGISQKEKTITSNTKEKYLSSVSELEGNANFLLEDYLITGNIKSLKESVELAKRTVRSTERFAPENLSRRNLLGRVLREYYHQNSDISDLQLAINQFEYVVENATKINHQELSVYQNNLALSYRDRYERFKNTDDLYLSIHFHEEALKFCPTKESSHLSLINNNLAASYYNLSQNLRDVEILDKGISYCREAIQIAKKDDDVSNYIMFYGNLGEGLVLRYYFLKDIIDLEEAMACYEKAIDKAGKQNPFVSVLYHGLGACFINRFDKYQEIKDLKKGFDFFEKAAKKGILKYIGKGLQSAKIWFNLAFKANSWEDVIRAYNVLEEISDKGFNEQIFRAYQEVWLRESQGLAANAAYAYIQNDDLENAVLTLEKGTVKLIRNSMALDNANVQSLNDLGYGDLFDSYNKALNDLKQLNKQFQANTYNSDIRKRVKTNLSEIIDKIRSISGFENFGVILERESLLKAAKERVLCYLGSSKYIGFAILVGFDEVENDLWFKKIFLPGLSESKVNDVLVGNKHSLKDSRGFFSNYMNWRSQTDSQQSFTKWNDSIEELTHWMWDEAIKHILKQVNPNKELTFIPIGKLNFFPWHIARYSDNSSFTGFTYALDLNIINYSPNSYSLNIANDIAEQINNLKLLSIEYSSETNPLPYAKLESSVIQNEFTHPKILNNGNANLENILAELPNYNVIHFSCHGSANLKKPLRSGLHVVDEQTLTIKKILNLNLEGIRLAYLSACETGLIGVELPDEMVNLPTAFFQTKTAGVIASLWSVGDESTALLTMKFYDIWRNDEVKLNKSLIEAQKWVRDSTNFEKIEYLKKKPKTSMRDKMIEYLSTARKEARSLSAPIHWGAFFLTGV